MPRFDRNHHRDHSRPRQWNSRRRYEGFQDEPWPRRLERAPFEEYRNSADRHRRDSRSREPVSPEPGRYHRKYRDNQRRSPFAYSPEHREASYSDEYDYEIGPRTSHRKSRDNVQQNRPDREPQQSSWNVRNSREQNRPDREPQQSSSNVWNSREMVNSQQNLPDNQREQSTSNVRNFREMVNSQQNRPDREPQQSSSNVRNSREIESSDPRASSTPLSSSQRPAPDDSILNPSLNQTTSIEPESTAVNTSRKNETHIENARRNDDGNHPSGSSSLNTERSSKKPDHRRHNGEKHREPTSSLNSGSHEESWPSGGQNQSEQSIQYARNESERSSKANVNNEPESPPVSPRLASSAKASLGPDAMNQTGSPVQESKSTPQKRTSFGQNDRNQNLSSFRISKKRVHSEIENARRKGNDNRPSGLLSQNTEKSFGKTDYRQHDQEKHREPTSFSNSGIHRERRPYDPRATSVPLSSPRKSAPGHSTMSWPSGGQNQSEQSIQYARNESERSSEANVNNEPESPPVQPRAASSGKASLGPDAMNQTGSPVQESKSTPQKVWTKEKEAALISLVKDRRILYDSNDPCYENQKKVYNSWRTISRDPRLEGETPKQVRVKWESLCQMYYKELKRLVEEHDPKLPEEFMQSMNFFPDTKELGPLSERTQENARVKRNSQFVKLIDEKLQPYSSAEQARLEANLLKVFADFGEPASEQRR